MTLRPLPLLAAAAVLAACGPPTHDAEVVPLDGAWVGGDVADVVQAYDGAEQSDTCEASDPRSRSRMVSLRYRLPPEAYGTDGPVSVTQSVRSDCSGVVETVTTKWSASDGTSPGAARTVFERVRSRVPAGAERMRQDDMAAFYGVPDAPATVPVVEFVDPDGVRCVLEQSGGTTLTCGGE